MEGRVNTRSTPTRIFRETSEKPRDFQMVGKSKDYNKANHNDALTDVLCSGTP